jgi:dipeptidyl aminopeptidase/acylaminoacyl peptidase
LLCASALALVGAAATPPVAPSCVEDVRAGYTAQPTTTTAAGSSWSPDGRYVAFTATTITGGSGDTNGAVTDAVVRDRQTGALEIVSRETGLAGAQLNVDATALQVSDDGNLVLFASAGEFVAGETNLNPDIYLRDRLAGTTVRVDLGYGRHGSCRWRDKRGDERGRSLCRVRHHRIIGCHGSQRSCGRLPLRHAGAEHHDGS